jgi:hypothetical protein
MRFEALRFGCEIRFKICDLTPEIQICKQIDLRFKTAIRFEICPSLVLADTPCLLDSSADLRVEVCLFDVKLRSVSVYQRVLADILCLLGSLADLCYK